MALLGNTGLHARGPVRSFGILSPGTERFSWTQSGPLKNFPRHDGDPVGSDKTGYPSGRIHPYSWSLPQKVGGLAAIQTAEGVTTVSGVMAAGKAAMGAASGVATVTGTAQLVVSGAGAAAGVATVAGNLQAALGGSALAAGVATVTASITAKAFATGTASGVATASLVRYATGQLIGSIAPAVTLEAAGFSTYLLDEEDIETGMTLRQAMRLVAAATAGKISGAAGTTVTIRNVGDSKDRIVATVDAAGNRNAIVYDLAD